MPRKKRWAVVLDCDGTLTPKPLKSIFHHLMVYGGLSEKALAALREIKDEYMPLAHGGQLTLEQETNWLQREFKVWSGDGLGPRQAAQAMTQVRFRPQVAQCLEWLKRRKVPVAIVSYGIRPFIRMALHANGLADLVDQVYALDLRVNHDTGRYQSIVPSTMVLPSNKGLWSRRFAGKHHVSHQRLLAVGDTTGDKLLGHRPDRRLGLACDENDRQKLLPHFDQVIVTDSFLPAWQWLKKRIR